jgi:hypothetical protein
VPIDPSAVPVSPGWSPTTTISAIQAIITVLLGGGGLYGIARGVALLWRIANDRAKQDNDAAAAVRKEMMEISDRQQKRIDDLEKSGREERAHFDREMAELRKAHAEEMARLRLAHSEEMALQRRIHEDEMRKLRDEVIGINRQAIARDQSAGRPTVVGNGKSAVSRATENFGQALRALDVPDDAIDG